MAAARAGSVLIRSEPISPYFCLTRFLHVNRYPLRLKTLREQRRGAGLRAAWNAHVVPFSNKGNLLRQQRSLSAKGLVQDCFCSRFRCLVTCLGGAGPPTH